MADLSQTTQQASGPKSAPMRNKGKTADSSDNGPVPGPTGAKPRLPAGSRKVLSWNGTDWRGELTVPGCPPFRFTAGSERRCFIGLDDCYRLHLQQQEQANG